MAKNTGANTYFVNGETVDAVAGPSANTGKEDFWLDGQVVQVLLFPDTSGNFFLMFF